jgi:hypothetical protein
VLCFQVIHEGALVTSVCHHIPLVIHLTPPVLHIMDDVFYDEDFDIMAIYYQVRNKRCSLLVISVPLPLNVKCDTAYVTAYLRHVT